MQGKRTLAARAVDQLQDLEAQHGKHAGHKVQNQAAQERKAQGGRRAHARRRIGQLCGWSGRFGLSGIRFFFRRPRQRHLARLDVERRFDGPAFVVRAAVGDDHAGKRQRIAGLEAFQIFRSGLKIERHLVFAVHRSIEFLKVDKSFGKRKELHLFFDLARKRGKVDADAVVLNLSRNVFGDNLFGDGLERLFKLAGKGAGFGRHLHRKFHRNFGGARNADFLASEVVDLGAQGVRAAVRRSPGNVQIEGQKHFARVHEVGDGPELVLLRRGPADLFGGPAARQLPFDTRSKTGVTRELPVRVPARFVLEQNADVVGRARNPGRLSRHKLHRHRLGLAAACKGRSRAGRTRTQSGRSGQCYGSCRRQAEQQRR